jgi:leucyl-tRNA synthetase
LQKPSERTGRAIFIADYACSWYGTGIVMGVPAHDHRDFDFAQKYIPRPQAVIAPPGYQASPRAGPTPDPGTMINPPLRWHTQPKRKTAVAEHLSSLAGASAW